VIELVDVDGNRRRVCSEGQMNGTKHETVLQVLTHRAERFRSKLGRAGLSEPTHAWSIDETGTIETSGLTGDGGAEQLEISEVNKITIPEEILQVHGFAPPKKREGTVRIIYENVNGFSNRLGGNEKVERARQLHDDLEVDVAAYCEHRLNMRHRKNVNGFNQLFKGGEAAVQSVVAHNTHENVGRVQQGGTSLLLFGHLTEQLDHDETGKDPSGLGRWSVMTLKGDGVRTRVVCGYNPCGNGKLNSGTTYQQQRRYFISKDKDLTCPRKRFHDDLIRQLEKWRLDGDRLIVCMDANEDIYKKSIGKSLTKAEGLNMSEVVGDFTGKRIGPTFFRGSKPIDGVWATQDVVVTHACIMPAGYGVGDHRLFVVDVQEESLVGNAPPRIQRFTSRRLNTKVSNGATQKYLTRLERNLERHRLIERLGNLYTSTRSRKSFRRKVNKLDKLSKDLMINAEKKCRRIKSGRIPFSPEASLWIRRTQVYRSLLRYHRGLIRNRGNLKRAARRCGIMNCLSLSAEETLARLKVCINQCDYYRSHGKYYRRKHLRKCLQTAREMDDDSREREILAIIKREGDRSFWRRVNYSMGKARGGSVRRVLVESPDQEGVLTEYTTAEAVQDAIFSNIHQKRFYLAENAPICSGGLRRKFGYNAVTRTAQRILNGTYAYPPDFDQATREICEECAKIRAMIPQDSMNTIITKEDWCKQWRGKRESTSSSASGLHFGHYIAGTSSDHISHFHALKATMILKRGVVLERWAQGLSVMLEKMFGCALITKLRSILLMEADFNATNKIIYGQRMLQQARRHNLIPEEIYSERNRLADDGTLAKVLFLDIVRQTRKSAGISSVDADNCYDRIAHPVASMVFQALGVPREAASSMLSTIQDMRFYLRTGFGDSQAFVSSTRDRKTQGMCQGNGASPAGWTVTNITMIEAHKRKGHGVHLRCPITEKTAHLAGTIFVDDTDVEHFNMHKNETVTEAHEALQRSIHNWGKLLIATGGALKPGKCFYHLISFSWLPDGTWRYDSNEGVPELQITVPLGDGTEAVIEHLPADTPTKTLGQMTCPTGDSTGAITQMQQKAQAWLAKASVSKLHKRNITFLLDKQFWPAASFGISSVTAPLETLEGCLMRTYYNLLPLCGIRRSVRRELRQLDRGFYGVGLPHPGVECFVAQLEKLLTNYGSSSGLGVHMQASMEVFIIEGGISTQLLSEPFARYGKWVTDCWLKSLWEKLDTFGFRVELAPLPLYCPREEDMWLMRALEGLGFRDEELRRLNRVRCRQQVLFLSDVFDASGRALDSRYLNLRPATAEWSTLIFPNERPSRQDVQLWQEALHLLAPRGHTQRRLGKLVQRGHKIWEWRLSPDRDRVFRARGKKMDIYAPLIGEGRTRRGNRWSCVQRDVPYEDTGSVCVVDEHGGGQISVRHQTAEERSPQPTQDLWGVLRRWKRTWIWDNLQWVGEDDWLALAISDDSCIAVTDGSYMRHLHERVNSAAVVIECTKGRGRLWCSFTETSRAACSYRGELLGLMVIHLLLLAVNEVNPDLAGSVHIYSDCLGALRKVQNLPPSRVPSRLAHADILKNILLNCGNLTFKIFYSHVLAHQDDRVDYGDLSRPAQLNVNMDYYAKQALWTLPLDPTPRCQALPLEPVIVTAASEKITADMGHRVRFLTHRTLARRSFDQLKILDTAAFDRVDWEMIYETLREVPRLFQQWACKQVMGIAGTMEWDKTVVRKCPSCLECQDTCAHVLFCEHAGRVATLHHTVDLLESWMQAVDTEPDLLDCIAEYAYCRGGRTMTQICTGLGESYQLMARDQDRIGWRRFMEGMICTRMRHIQGEYTRSEGIVMTPERWAKGVILKLLEATHGQWIYRNVQIHDDVAGTRATLRKEEILRKIEEQMELGATGLLEEDQWMMEVNLGDMENSSGEAEEYWLLAIRAAREAAALTRQQTQQGLAETPRDGR